MSLRHKFPFFALLFSLLFFSPHAVHGRHGSSALRHQHVHRQVDLPAVQSGLGNALSGLGLDSGGTSSTPSSQTSNTAPGNSPAAVTPSSQGTSSSQTSNSPAAVTPPSQSTSSSQTSNSPASLPSTSSPSSLPLTSSPVSSSPPTSGPTSSPTITSPQSSQTSSQPTSTSSCSLGVDLFGQCILQNVLSTTSSGSTPVSSTPTDVPSTSLPSSQPQTSTSLASSSGTPTSPLLSSNPISLPPLLSNTLTSSPSPSSNNPASSPSPSSNNPASSPSPSSSNAPASSPPLLSNTPSSLPLTPSIPISLPLSSSNPISLPPLSLNTPVSSPPPAASSPPVSSTDSPSLSFQLPTKSQPAPSLSDNQSSSPSPPPSSSTPIDPCGPLGVLQGLCVTSSGTPIRASIPSSGSTPQQTLTLNPSSPILNSQSPPFSIPSSSNPGVSSSSGLPVPLSYTQSLSPLASGNVTGTVSGSLTTSAPPVISFPSADTTSSGNQTSSVQPTGSFIPVVTLPPNSQFSYVTMTSLLGTSLQSSSIPPTLTNPDAATTTFSLPDPSISATGSAPGAPLPSYLPARIYAPDQDAINSLPSDYTICSFLFTSFLSWAFVAQNTQSQGQIFSWAPVIISTALNISTTQTPPYALQVFTPATYDGPSDVSMLLTEYLFFLPDEYVLVLANEIKATDSPFYTDIGYPYIQLAIQIDPAFALTSVSNPNAVPGSASGASSHGNKSRTDTIIGVVGGLGGLALIILGILIFNGVKRSRQLRHHRLSDPNLPNDPYPDRSGREFDQDSVGGPRRRSFYFAEDSLRGGQPQTAEQSVVSMAQAQTQYVTQPESQIQYIPRTSPENIRERRAPVVPGAISAPILTQSSLNW